MNVRVKNTTTGVIGNVIHKRSEFNNYGTKCKVHGGWTLVNTPDAVTCATCIRRMGRS